MYFYLLVIISITFSNTCVYADYASEPERQGQELLLCRKCGADVADSNYLINKVSLGARNVDKQNLFGKQNVTVQSLVNPYGIKFNIITMEKARCDILGGSQGADSWFPGYSWRICACPHCGQHLGWAFKSANTETKADELNSFFGIILSNILGENLTDSIIMLPKMYKM